VRHTPPPADTILTTSSAQEHEDDSRGKDGAATPPPPSEKSPSPTLEAGAPTSVSYKADEVTELLRKALLQAISTSLKSLPSSSFPIPATLLYTNHILPSRPAFPTLVVSPASWSENLLSGSTDAPHIDTDITIKASSHKSLTTFLKGAEKSALLTLKPPQKQQPDVLVTSVNASHPDVIHHTPFVTVKDLELKAAKKAAREEKEKESRFGREVEIKELWKPHQSTVELFEGMGSK
jgi:translation initiation factor 2D